MKTHNHTINPSRRTQLSDKGLKALKHLGKFIPIDFNVSLLTTNTIQDSKIFELIKGIEIINVFEDGRIQKEVPILYKGIDSYERIWKLTGKELDVFIFDTGNGWASILSIRDKNGKILLGLDKDGNTQI